MSLKRLLGAVAVAMPLALVGSPAAQAGCVANQYIQVWSCAVNVPGGACYRWYSYQTNPPYKASCPSSIIGNKYVYNRYQF